MVFSANVAAASNLTNLVNKLKRSSYVTIRILIFPVGLGWFFEKKLPVNNPTKVLRTLLEEHYNIHSIYFDYSALHHTLRSTHKTDHQKC